MLNKLSNMPRWLWDKEGSCDMSPSSSTRKMLPEANVLRTCTVPVCSLAPIARRACASRRVSGTQQPCIISVHDQMHRTMKRLTLKRHKTGAKKQMLVYVSDALPFRR